MKVIAAFVSIIIGVLIFFLWVAGSEGHLRLPPRIAENWVFLILIISCLSIAVFLLSKKEKRKF